jgi:hypothetical protein
MTLDGFERASQAGMTLVRRPGWRFFLGML